MTTKIKYLSVSRKNGAYGRTDTIRVGPSTCNVCLEQTTCIVADTSDGEYNETCLCQPCIVRAFDNYKVLT